MSLLIVIVDYRTPDLVIDCLRSLEPEVGAVPDARVVVTDASPDDAAARIADAIGREGWGDWASVQPLERNGGFAYGNNAAIAPALASDAPPDYVWLLNPDTLVHRGAIRTLLDFLDAHPEVGIAGSRLEYPDGTPQPSAFRFPTFWSEVDNGARLGLLTRLLGRYVVAPPPPGRSAEAQWVSGASMMIRREVFADVGLLDEGFFMYYEETDFCRRAAEAGWACWYVPEARVTHLIGAASGVTDRRRPRPAYWFDSRSRYFRKRYGSAAKAAIDVAWAAAYATFRLRRAIQRKPDTDPPHLLRDFVRHNLWPMGRQRGASSGSSPGRCAADPAYSSS